MPSSWLAASTFVYLLIFCRLGSAIMLMPGIGEAYVPPRVRLLLALSISALLAPVLAPHLPAQPTTVTGLMVVVGGELIIGLFIGAVARVFINAANVAGTVIATQSGLASAQIFDMTQTSQSAVVANLLSVTAVTLLFAMDLHHIFLGALRSSYDAFPAGLFPPIDDMANYMAQSVTHAFALGVRIAAPQIVVGLVLYLGAGVLSRLMPSMQIFFVLMAPQLLLSFFVLMVTISGSMLWYMNQLGDVFSHFPALP